jgi:Flp pilus assembly protein TadG
MRWLYLIRGRRAKAAPLTARESKLANLRWRLFRRDRHGAIAVMYALMLLPLLAICALAVDLGFYILARSEVDTAADAAAIHAVRIASQLYNAGSASRADAETAGVTAGQQWFAAQLGNIGIASVAASDVSVAVNYQPTPGGFVSTVSYTGTVATHLGAFITPSWTIASTFSAQLTNNYAEVIMLLDNSSSMAIGATTADMAKLNQLSPCDPSNAYYFANNAWSNASLDSYSVYQYSYGAQTYHGPNPHPVVTSVGTMMPSSATQGPSCQGALPMSNGQYPKAGPPCAFACHWDGAKPAGQGNDLWAMARRNNIRMRFDLVKNAVNLVINEMQAKDSGNLGIGIFTFDTTLKRVYPATGEAGGDWSGALAAVGTPPVFPSVLDTGIQPSVALRTGNNNNSYFANAMGTLATRYVTASGNGATAATPRKSLFIVTDGFEDDTARQAMPYSVCQQFKNMGYAVYVIYTPYYPVMHIAYFTSNWAPIVEGSGPTSISYNLQACATGPADYLSAADGPSLDAAMLNFLAKAMTAPTHLTQ